MGSIINIIPQNTCAGIPLSNYQNIILDSTRIFFIALSRFLYRILQSTHCTLLNERCSVCRVLYK